MSVRQQYAQLSSVSAVCLSVRTDGRTDCGCWRTDKSSLSSLAWLALPNQWPHHTDEQWTDSIIALTLDSLTNNDWVCGSEMCPMYIIVQRLADKGKYGNQQWRLLSRWFTSFVAQPEDRIVHGPIMAPPIEFTGETPHLNFLCSSFWSEQTNKKISYPYAVIRTCSALEMSK